MAQNPGEPMAAAELPAGLAEPLHILSPDGGGFEGWLWALLALLLAWLYRRWRKRATEPPSHEPRPQVPAPAPLPAMSALARAIESLRYEILVSENFRDGCHRLADLLRRHGEGAAHYELSVLTAGEIVRRLGDRGLGTVFGLLADLQFRRHEPTREEFVDICEMATSAADGTPGGGKDAT